MPKFVLTDVSCTINGTSFSDHIAAITLDVSSDEVETTAFGSAGGFRTRVAGLKDASLTLSFHNDFGNSGSSAVDSTIWGLFGSQATVVIVPTSGSVSSTNPSYSGLFLVSQANPVSGSVGDLATRDVTWPLAGSGITRGTV
jgi:predicted secreted protein